MDYLLSQPVEGRPAVETLQELRTSCDAVLARETFGVTFTARLVELVPPDHPMLAPEVPLLDLATALLDPVRDPARYGGIDQVEARWQQLGAWLGEIGMPDDARQHLVRAAARAARDVCVEEEWDSAASSGWAALQLWMQAHLDAGGEPAEDGHGGTSGGPPSAGGSVGAAGDRTPEDDRGPWADGPYRDDRWPVPRDGATLRVTP